MPEFDGLIRLYANADARSLVKEISMKISADDKAEAESILGQHIRGELSKRGGWRIAHPIVTAADEKERAG